MSPPKKPQRKGLFAGLTDKIPQILSVFVVLALIVLILNTLLTRFLLPDLNSRVNELDRLVKYPQPTLISPQPSGSISVQLGLIEDEASRNKLVEFGKKALPIFDRELGLPYQHWDIVAWVDPELKPGAEFRRNVCQSGTSYGSIIMRNPTNLPDYAHELAHAYLGCYLLYDTRVGEGMVEAAADLVVKEIQPDLPKIVYSREDYRLLNRPGIGGGKDSWMIDSFLAKYREEVGGAAFRLFEEDHPGFLREFHKAVYKKLYEGEVVWEIDPVAVGDEVQPGFADWFAAQHIFDSRPKGNQLLTSIQGTDVYIYAIKRDKDRKETPWLGLPIHVSIKLNGTETGQLNETIGDTGTVRMVSYGLANLPNPPAPGDSITIRVTGGGLTDEFTFTPQ